MLTKTLHFSDDVLDTLRSMTWEQRGNQFAGTIANQLDRDLYVATNKALEAMGGKWNRKEKAHLFPEDPRQQVEGLLENGTLEIEKDGYFVTPPEISVKLCQLSELDRDFDGSILEPSAGTGELAEVIRDTFPNADLWVGEKSANRQAVLVEKGFSTIRNQISGTFNFLTYNPTLGQNAIIQNPPFENHQDIDHIRHAFECLSLGGVLVSVMSEGPFFRDDKKSIDFRDWLNSHRHRVVDLPHGAFHTSGTDVKTRIVAIWK